MHRSIWKFTQQQLDAVDFRDKTVLDVGCWDGYWSLYAERRGARSVLAADDSSQNWSDGQGLVLAKELYESKVEINQGVSVYDLASLGRKFDIILLLGVYYHLVDPYLAFAQVRHCCHAGSVVLIEGNEGLDLAPKSSVFDPTQRTSKFTPSLEALEELLRSAYLRVTSHQRKDPASAESVRQGWKWRLRVCGQALLGSRRGVAKLLGPTEVRRVFLTCVPMTGQNDAHFYRPPLGLHAYDSRFA
jgi:tRNA (mo5U34)-methyltransferase